jgi:hypothetical protein
LPYTALCTCPTSLLATESLINHANLFKPQCIQNVARNSDGRTGQQMERSTVRNNCSTLPTSAALSRTQSVLAGTPIAIWSRRDSHKRNRMQQCYCYWLVLGQCMVHDHNTGQCVTCVRAIYGTWTTVQEKTWLVLGQCMVHGPQRKTSHTFRRTVFTGGLIAQFASSSSCPACDAVSLR